MNSIKQYINSKFMWNYCSCTEKKRVHKKTCNLNGHFIYNYFILFYFLSPLLALSDSLPPSLQYQKEGDNHNQPKIKHPDSNTTTTANPLQHQFNPNTINPKLMKNHHKPNLKSTQNKTPKNLFGKI